MLNSIKPPGFGDEHIFPLGAPPDWDNETRGQCVTLQTVRTEETIVSCWQASWIDRLRLLFTGRVWLTVYSKQHPPVCLTARPTAKPVSTD